MEWITVYDIINVWSRLYVRLRPSFYDILIFLNKLIRLLLHDIFWVRKQEELKLVRSIELKSNRSVTDLINSVTHNIIRYQPNNNIKTFINKRSRETDLYKQIEYKFQLSIRIHYFGLLGTFQIVNYFVGGKLLIKW